MFTNTFCEDGDLHLGAKMRALAQSAACPGRIFPSVRFPGNHPKGVGDLEWLIVKWNIIRPGQSRLVGSIMRWSSRNPTQLVAQHTCCFNSFLAQVATLSALILELAECSHPGRNTGRPSDILSFLKLDGGFATLGGYRMARPPSSRATRAPDKIMSGMTDASVGHPETAVVA
jgi:hypothetical protein